MRLGQEVIDMESTIGTTLFWVSILERDGWIVIHVDDRQVGIVISMTEAGKEYLKVAGYHTGESMYIGERHNILAIKVERIDQNQQREMLSKIHDALPPGLRGLPVTFL